jgi:hypothetical protein
MSIEAVAGAGKSKTGLGILRGLVGPEGRIAAVDTEHGRLQLGYAGVYPGTVQPTGFDVIELVDFGVEFYIEAIQAAVRGRYDGLFVDSVSHAWAGKGGILERMDAFKGGGQNTFSDGWGKYGTPAQNRFVDALLSSNMHVIVTIRKKVEYVMKPDATGKIEVVKMGLKPIQREGFDYEFDLIAHMDRDHTMTFSKVSGAFDDLDGAIIPRPEPVKFGESLLARIKAMGAEWKPPEFARTFKVGAKLVTTKGVTFETYTEALNLGVQYDKVTQKGAAREAMSTRFKAASVTDLTEAQALAFIAEMEKVIAEPPPKGDPK